MSTLVVTLPVANGLKSNFLKILPAGGTLLKNFKETVSADLSRRFLMGLGAESISAIAACLDPCHKSLKFLNEPLQLLIHKHVRSLVDDTEDRSKTGILSQKHLQKNLEWPCFWEKISLMSSSLFVTSSQTT